MDSLELVLLVVAGMVAFRLGMSVEMYALELGMGSAVADLELDMGSVVAGLELRMDFVEADLELVVVDGSQPCCDACSSSSCQ